MYPLCKGYILHSPLGLGESSDPCFLFGLRLSQAAQEEEVKAMKLEQAKARVEKAKAKKKAENAAQA